MSLFDNQEPQPIFSIGADETSSYYLLQTVRWTKFLAIIGFILIGLMIMVMIPIMFMSASVAALPGVSTGVPMGITMFFVVLSLFLYIYPTLALLRFSNNMKLAILGADQGAFNTALRHQRNLYRYIGILVIVIISVYALIFLVGMASIF
jgi:uncharacterized integral membrane protein